MSNYIDVERLHAVLEHKLIGRGSGQTTARLVQMAQSVEFLPNGNLVYISNSDQAAKGHRADFKMILEYLGYGDLLTVTTVDRIRFENGCEVRFLSAASAENLKNSLRGARLDNYFVDHFAEYLINADTFLFLETRLKP